MANIYSNLPKAIYITSIDDGGEYGAYLCPHCNARGRYIYNFMCDDGQLWSAMRGCFQHFNPHRFAHLGAQLITKQREAERKGMKLGAWDSEVLKAIQDFAHQVISEQQADEIINRIERKKTQWRKSRGYR